MRLQVLSPGEVLLDIQNVKKVIVQAEDGEIGIFPGHTFLLAETVDGPLRYETEDGNETILLSGGILKITTDAVVIFSGSFFEPSDGTNLQFQNTNLETEQTFSRLTAELSRHLKI